MNINSLSLSWRALLPLTVIVLAGCSAMGRSECEQPVVLMVALTLVIAVVAALGVSI